MNFNITNIILQVNSITSCLLSLITTIVNFVTVMFQCFDTKIHRICVSHLSDIPICGTYEICETHNKQVNKC